MRIGVDVGGTKIEGVLLDRQGRELARKRVPTPKGNYAATFDTISTLVA
jgi:fructokinase